jgi:hypothetical protein
MLKKLSYTRRINKKHKNSYHAKNYNLECKVLQSNKFEMIYGKYFTSGPVTIAERSKAWTVFARADAGTMVSNPNQGMDV